MKQISLLLAMVLIVANPANSVARQSTARQDWSSLQSLAVNQNLVIDNKAGKQIKGKFVSVSDTALVIQRGATNTELLRGDIKRVFRLPGRSRGHSALKGAAIGGAVGLGTGVGLYLPARDDIEPAVVPVFTVLGAGIGAGLGALFGKGQRRELLYAAP